MLRIGTYRQFFESESGFLPIFLIYHAEVQSPKISFQVAFEYKCPFFRRHPIMLFFERLCSVDQKLHSIQP